MCGIFAHLSKEPIQYQIESSKNIQNRGPDHTSYSTYSDNVALCFHRLKINDLSDNGNQPIIYQDISLICNGEIYNSDKLKEEFDVEWKSNSDCEVLPYVYRKYGFKEIMKSI